MQHFIIDSEVFELIPNLHCAVLVLKNVEENKILSDSEAAEISQLLRTANASAQKFLTSDVISENAIVKNWRDVFSRFPTKKGARCSLENLLKRVLKGNPVGSISPSIDITNSISLKYGFPIGAEDAAKFVGDLHLGVMQGSEEFYPYGSDEADPPRPGEIGYFDEKGAVCRCLNWRDGQRTEVTDETTSEFIIMECIDDRLDDLKNALNDLDALMQKYLGAEVIAKEIMDASKTSLEI